MGGQAVRPELEELAASARAELVRVIEASGAFAGDPGWRQVFAAVPRHLFVPSYYVGVAGGYERRRCDDPAPGAGERWLLGAYQDRPLGILLRDGELLSTSSQPSLMAMMLVALGVRDGDRVLEIGTGSGYNAALLAQRLGAGDLVTTIDLDPQITESARRHLDSDGHHPVVVTGDGAHGVPARAPFDRIIATCAPPSVPPAWLGQCRPGGRILVPYATGVAALTVRDAGHAEGRFLHTPAYFVPLRGAGRGQRAPWDAGELPPEAGADELLRFLLALTAGRLDPREAYALWKREGRPQRERYGLTAGTDGTRAWLDDPHGPHVWPVP